MPSSPQGWDETEERAERKSQARAHCYLTILWERRPENGWYSFHNKEKGWFHFN